MRAILVPTKKDESDSDDKSFKRRLEKSIKKDLAEAEGGKTKSWKEKIKIQSKMIEAVFEVYVRVLKRATDDIEDSVGATNNSDSSDESDTDSDYDKAVIVNQRRHMHQNRKEARLHYCANLGKSSEYFSLN